MPYVASQVGKKLIVAITARTRTIWFILLLISL